MFRWFAGLLLFCSFAFACAVADDDLVSRCPTPDKVIQSSCKEIAYKDLPDGARTLLHKLKCDYDCGSAVDLNGDGSPEYKFCCKAASHGPCGSVVIGKIGTQWKDLTAKEGVLGFDGACNGFVVLMSQHPVSMMFVFLSSAPPDRKPRRTAPRRSGGTRKADITRLGSRQILRSETAHSLARSR
jgi:hypothetical protein